jgi:hypothetical protein
MVVGGGLVLYQLTSLVLGPAAEIRQLPLAITAPSIDPADVSQPVIDNVNLVLGTIAQPVAPAPTAAVGRQKPVVRTAVSPRASLAPQLSVQVPKTPPAPRPVATPTPEPSQRPQPIIIKPQPPTD